MKKIIPHTCQNAKKTRQSKHSHKQLKTGKAERNKGFALFIKKTKSLYVHDKSLQPT